MTGDDFDSFCDDFMEDQQHLLGIKGADYTRGTADEDDRLVNFKEAAGRLGLTPLQVWAVLANKHFTAVLSYVKTGQAESEAIRGRFLDLANYATLGAALVDDSD